MTTLEMEIILMEYFDIRKKLIVPCVTSRSTLVNFETDLLVLSKSSYATGVEIKVSKSDLKNDIKKRQWKNLDNQVYRSKTGKEFYFGMFKYFYYAIPEEILEETIKQIPDWCGILIVRKHRRKNQRVIEHRKPTLIHSKKWTSKERYKLARLGCLRILKHKKYRNAN